MDTQSPTLGSYQMAPIGLVQVSAPPKCTGEGELPSTTRHLINLKMQKAKYLTIMHFVNNLQSHLVRIFMNSIMAIVYICRKVSLHYTRVAIPSQNSYFWGRNLYITFREFLS